MKILFSIGTILISTCAVSGVMIHGAHLDQIASTGTPSHISQSGDPGTHATATPNNSTHPHAEFQASSLFRYLEYNSNNSSPMERSRQKRTTVKSPTIRGRHAFDNTFLPVIS
jgi:hypothetical protein